MSGLLYGVGAVAVVVGIVAIGFGIPINEFSFGNTLIGAGTTAAVGGLIVIGLGAAVAQLQRIAETLATRTPIRSSQPFEAFENAAGSRAAPAPGRIPFPPKSKSDTGIREPHPLEQRMGAAAPAEMPVDEPPARSFAPTLRNPDERPISVEDEVSLSPQQPIAAPAAADLGEPARPAPPAPPFGSNGFGMAEKRHESTLDAGWRSPPPPPAPAQMRQPQTAYFDAMWPAEGKPAKSPAPDLSQREPVAAPLKRPASELRTAAILKSGVVDGMGYTLYVDGSIEAELPQGTLRFASINELRSHLEKHP